MPAAGAQSLAHMGDWSICMVSLHWLTGLLMGYRDELWPGSVLGTEDVCCHGALGGHVLVLLS